MDVFFLVLSVYEYWMTGFELGWMAVGIMCIVYFGGIYFGASQKYRLDQHIISLCEQGKHDNAFKSGVRQENQMEKYRKIVLRYKEGVDGSGVADEDDDEAGQKKYEASKQ